MFNHFFELQELILSLREEEKRQGKKMFLGIPDHWYESPGPKFRCKNDHVSKMVLKTEERGDRCMACGDNVLMTFPEDKDFTSLI